MSSSAQNEHRSYDKINLETRKKLVDEVVYDQRSLSKTAKKLGIKLSTAKVIVKRFKEEGTFFETKKKKKQRLEEEKNVQQASQRDVDQSNFIASNLPIPNSYAIDPMWNCMHLPPPYPYFPYGQIPYPFGSELWRHHF